MTGSPALDSHGKGLQGTSGNTSDTQSSKDDDTTFVWEVSSRNRKPKWLKGTMKEAKE